MLPNSATLQSPGILLHYLAPLHYINAILHKQQLF